MTSVRDVELVAALFCALLDTAITRKHERNEDVGNLVGVSQNAGDQDLEKFNNRQ